VTNARKPHLGNSSSAQRSQNAMPEKNRCIGNRFSSESRSARCKLTETAARFEAISITGRYAGENNGRESRRGNGGAA
jgi:hypothetical protein